MSCPCRCHRVIAGGLIPCPLCDYDRPDPPYVEVDLPDDPEPLVGPDGAPLTGRRPFGFQPPESSEILGPVTPLPLQKRFQRDGSDGIVSDSS